MSLLSLVLTIAVVGVITWLILQTPMPAPFRNIILGIVVLFVIVWVLQQLGLISGFPFLKLT
jgi:uncharacterized membrane protein YeaQ/YmgE (transglycosylase-associated protein family)